MIEIFNGRLRGAMKFWMLGVRKSEDGFVKTTSSE